MTLSFDNPRDVEPILNEPDNQPDWADEKAAELLPCRPFACRNFRHEQPAVGCEVEHLHSINCPASWRPAVAQALRDADVAAERRGYERGINAIPAERIVDAVWRYADIEDGVLWLDRMKAIASVRALTAKEPNE